MAVCGICQAYTLRAAFRMSNALAALPFGCMEHLGKNSIKPLWHKR